MKAARGLIRDFGEVEQLQVSVKGPGDFVSTADLKAERTLKTELNRARPGYGLLFEESGARQRRRPAPPLDRRPARRHHQFPARHPAFRDLDRARARRRDRRRAGLRADPRRDVSRPKRARRLCQRPPAAGLGAAPARRGGDRHRHARSRPQPIIRPISRSCRGDGGDQRRPPHRRRGARSRLCRGRALDGFWEFGLSPWDIAAGILLVREAGGYVSDLSGGHDMMTKRRRARRQRPSAPAARGLDPGGLAHRAGRRVICSIVR